MVTVIRCHWEEVNLASMQTEALLKHPKDDHISKSDDAIEEVHTSYVLKKNNHQKTPQLESNTSVTLCGLGKHLPM